MKKGQSPPPRPEGADPEKSLAAAVEQMARLLRSEVKLKERATRGLPASSQTASFKNVLEQIAKLLRSQVRRTPTPKKRSWKQQQRKKPSD